MSQNYSYPSSSSVTVAAVGSTGVTAPTQAIEIAGVDGSSILRALSVSSAGVLNVNISGGITNPLPVTDAAAEASLAAINGHIPQLAIGSHLIAASLAVSIASDQIVPISASSLPLPTGAATEATLSALSAKIPATLGQHLMAASLSVAIASDQSTLPVSVASLPLPSGAATEATLSALSAKFGSLGQKAMVGSAPVVIASDQSAIPASQSGSWSILNITGTITLPTGAASAANQATEIASLASIDGKLGSLGQKAMAGSAPVVIASDQSSIPVAATSTGSVPLQFVRNDYSSVNVTTAAYVTLIASTSGITNVIEIFDSSGQTLKIAFGAAASEVDQFLVFPGGNGRITCRIPASTRISIKAVSANATVGEIDVNLYT